MLQRKDPLPRLLLILICLLLTFSLTSPVSAQSTSSGVALTGSVLDPTGAVIPGASLTFHPTASEPVRTVTADSAGRYSITLAPGNYTVSASAQGFAPLLSKPLQLTTARALTFDIRLRIEDQIQQVDVSAESANGTDPDRNGDSLTLKGKAIDTLPLDQNQLLQQLQGLSGGASPDLYVDGFSGGTLPPRDTIREIRINQNPYSAINDTNPVNGRIEIFTKPGGKEFHGDLYSFGNDSSFNSLNPFVTQEPPYHSTAFFGGLNGPVNRHTSFFLNGGHASTQTQSVINAQVLNSSLQQVPFTQAVATPNSYTGIFSRLETSLGSKSTLTFRYSLDRNLQTNAGIGQFALVSQGFDNTTNTQTLQLSNSQIVSTRIVNDTRFQYIRSRVNQTPASLATAVVVQGAFTDGGNNAGAYHDNQDRFELQNYISQTVGKHFFTYGARLRSTRDANVSRANYSGDFIFSSLAAYQLTQQGIASGQTPAQIRAAGGGASQFNLTAGTPSVTVSVFDLGLFFQDDWKARPNLTLSPGLRVESQDRIPDHADWAPRLGVAYGFLPGRNKTPRFTLRGGAGIFYKRFTSGYVLQAARQNGVTQQEFIVNNPDFFPTVPTPSTLATQASSSTVFQIGPAFHAPYYISDTLSVERQVGTHGSVTLGYYGNRGVHTQVTRNINAPLPGTYNPTVPTSGLRPLGGSQNVFEYDSVGLLRLNRLYARFFLHFKDEFYFYGFYELRSSRSDDNNGGFPSNQYNQRADYGRTADNARNVLNFGGNGQLPFGFRTGGYVRLSSGLPFNIVVGQDLNGDAQFNDRPAFATDLTRSSVVATRYGTFDTSPIAGQTIIPINYGQGPGIFSVDLQFGRTFSFGPALKPPPGAPAANPAPKLAPGKKPHIDRRFSLDLSISTQNVLNHVNLSTPVGTLNSPLFGRSTALAPGFSNSANRLINLQSYFRF